jgi:hypothetical protein
MTLSAAIPLRDTDRAISPEFADCIERTRACLERFERDEDRLALFGELDCLLVETARAMPRNRARAAAHIEHWRAALHHHWLQAPIVSRCFHKPLGYAGDYAMMNLIYRNMPEGDSPLARALHQHTNSSLAATAVRSRRRWIVQQIQAHAAGRRGRYQITSMACGPAVEMSDLVRESFLADRADFTCIDQDAEALAHASAGLNETIASSGRAATARYERWSVKNLLAGTDVGKQDFVYSLGLFDYLNDRTARRFTEVLFQLVAPGGRLVIGNFGPDVDARFTMEMICDWFLIYRTPSQVFDFTAGLPDDAKVRVTAEATGTNLFLVVDKPAG